MILIDTNIFLELLMDQPNAEDCERLLSAVSEGKVEALVTRYSLHAIESLLRDPDVLASFLRNIENSAGLFVYETDTSEELVISILMKQIRRDFDDSLQYYASKKVGAKVIVSFDRHFDGLDIPRVDPKAALQLFESKKKA